jgi:hypothetical protein
MEYRSDTSLKYDWNSGENKKRDMKIHKHLMVAAVVARCFPGWMSPVAKRPNIIFLLAAVVVGLGRISASWAATVVLPIGDDTGAVVWMMQGAGNQPRPTSYSGLAAENELMAGCAQQNVSVPPYTGNTIFYARYSDLVAGSDLPSTIQPGTYTLFARIGSIGSEGSGFPGLNDITAGTNDTEGAVAGFFCTEQSGSVDAVQKAENMKNAMYIEFNSLSGITYTQPTEADPIGQTFGTWTFVWTVAADSPLVGTDPFFGTYVEYYDSNGAYFDDSLLEFEPCRPKLIWEYERGLGIPGSDFDKFMSTNLPLWLESMAFIDGHVLTQGSAAELPTIASTQQAVNFRLWNQSRNRTIIYDSGLVVRRITGDWSRSRLASTEIARITDFINHSGATNVVYAFQSVLSKDEYVTNAVPTVVRVQYMDELIGDVEASLSASNLLSGINLEWALIDANPAQNEPYDDNFRTLMAAMTASNRNFTGIYFDHPCTLFNADPTNLIRAINFVVDTLGPEYGTTLWAGWLVSGGQFVVPMADKFRGNVLLAAQIFRDMGCRPNLSRILFTDFNSLLTEEFPDAIAGDGQIRQLEVYREFRSIMEPPTDISPAAGLRISAMNGMPEINLRLPVGMPFELCQTPTLISAVWSVASGLSSGEIDPSGLWTNIVQDATDAPQMFFKYRMGSP